ncbi:MAG TPA: hypothetical protein DCS93_43700 [Microscillaceae bacterium]|nr:hypothetical protein [Microscillaceae bacterium]
MKKLRYVLLLLILLLVGGYFYLKQDFSKISSLIIYNGPIITMENQTDKPEAIFVKDGVIAMVGSKADVMQLKESDTEMIDLQGKTLMPGFIDPHTHPLVSALLIDMVDLSGFTHKSPEEVWAHLAKEVKKFEPGKWVFCRGLDPILTKNLASPHISKLDSIAPNNPLFIFAQTLHNYWANSLAFKAVEITAQTKDPSKTSFYEKDAQGKLTGMIVEQAAMTAFKTRIFKEIGQKRLIKNLAMVMDNYAKAGNTTIVTTGLTTFKKNIVKLCEHLSGGKPTLFGQGLATLNIFPDRKPAVRHFVYVRHDAQHLLPDSPQNGDDFFKIVGVKYWYDGSPLAGSMYMRKPYFMSRLTRKSIRINFGHRGKYLIKPNQMVTIIENLQKKGWQIATHAHGDQAIDDVLWAYETANKKTPVKKFRHRLEHCMLLNEQNLTRMNTLNMTPSFHINFVYYYGESLKNDILGKERANKILKTNTAFKNKVHPSLHADQPMYASDPFSLMATAVNRKTKEGSSLGAPEAITIWQALQTMTTNAAWQIKMEDKIGSIKKGKYGDFVILDQNPLKAGKSSLRNIKVLRTIVHGNTVFKK